MKPWLFGTVLDDAPSILSGPDWRQANPRWIHRALEHSQARSHGGWFVLDASRRITHRPRLFIIANKEYVAFRDRNGVVIGDNACPHMGASLAEGRVCNDKIVCPWHGLAMGRTPIGRWRPLPVHDDGILTWVRLDDTAEQPTAQPILPERPSGHQIAAVMRLEAGCDPTDVVANRLDPWHGTHYHPHSFMTLKVIERSDHDIVVRVAYRVLGPLAVEVDARFHSPQRNSIVMTIIRGEGAGSLVETHATPIAPGKSVVIEATIATSDRPGFAHAARWLSRIIQPIAEKRARRLWVEDAVYAQRRYALRQRAAYHDANPAEFTPTSGEPPPIV